MCLVVCFMLLLVVCCHLANKDIYIIADWSTEGNRRTHVSYLKRYRHAEFVFLRRLSWSYCGRLEHIPH